MTVQQWTPSQLEAIEATGRSVLVSAGAGSGKTAVLAERCAHLVASARPPCAVDGLLVVTFTEAAAAEMRDRIATSLRRRLESAPSDRRLRTQLALLDTASISTIHAFCKRTLDRYFAAAKLDPATPILDEYDARLLRRETCDRVFDRFDDRRDHLGAAFDALLAAYAPSGEQGLVAHVLRLDGFLSSLPQPEQWIAEARGRYENASADKLGDGWRTLFSAELADELSEQLKAVRRQLGQCRGGAAIVEPVAECLCEYESALSAWLASVDALASASTDAPAGSADHAGLVETCAAIGAFTFPTIPRLTKAIKEGPLDELATFKSAAGEARAIRETLFRARLRDVFGRGSEQEWADGIARTAPHVRTLLELAAAYRADYQAAKAELGVLDFADLERYAYDLLSDEDNGVAARMRDRFEYILVDEYQDVSPIQAEILRLVSRETETGRANNLFAVGDVKQSIYRFRLAEPRLFLDRMDRAARRGGDVDSVAATATATGDHVIALVENFRSAPDLIHAMNGVFEKLIAGDLGGIEYDAAARLKPGLPAPDGAAVAPPIELHVLDKAAGSDGDAADMPDGGGGAGGASRADDTGGADESGEGLDWEAIEREAYVVARRIEEFIAEGRRYGEIAVLMRSMSIRGPLFVRTLTNLGIPAFADVAGGFLDSLEIRDIVAVLSLLDNEQQDIPLASLLRSPLIGEPLTDEQLVEIRTARRGVPFHAAVRTYAAEGSNASLRSRLAELRDRLAVWRQRVGRRPLADVVWSIYEETGYLAYVSGLPGGPQRRANLIGLHHRARQFDTFARHGLYRFLRFIEGLADADEDLEPGRVRSEADDVVRVMSIHRSKGLQYPVVFVAELGKRFNLRDARGAILFDRKLGVAMDAVDLERRLIYPTLPHKLVQRAVEDETLAEELRVLYVALTRAESRLVLVGTCGLSKIEEALSRYAGHTGPIPLLDRRRASGALDWILAALGCQPPGSVSLVGGGIEVPVALAAASGDDRVGTMGDRAVPYEIHAIDAEDMAGWSFEAPRRPEAAKRLAACAALAAPPVANEVAAAPADASSVDTIPADAASAVESPVATVARRFGSTYAARDLCRVPAVAAASELKSRWNLPTDDDDAAEVRAGMLSPTGSASPLPGAPSALGSASHASSSGSASVVSNTRSSLGTESPASPSSSLSGGSGVQAGRTLPEPVFRRSMPGFDAGERGTLTHEFLEIVDRQQPCDAANLEAQLKAAVKRGAFAVIEAAEIDLDSIAWFYATPLGMRLRGADCRVLREWPFVIGVEPQRYDPAASARDAGDFVLVRGIIDCLFDDGDGWEILDYKTDRVSGDALTARADVYRGQVDIYTRAVELTWPRKVTRRWLAFLSAREIVELCPRS